MLPPRERGNGNPQTRIDSLHCEPQAITLEVRAGTPAFLATSEVHYPGWGAFIDGSEVPVWVTNGAFRGLPIPAGDHVVEFRFAPRIVYLGAGISAFSVLIGLLICWDWRFGLSSRLKAG